MAMEEKMEEWCVKVRGVGSVDASGITRELGLESVQGLGHVHPFTA